MNTKEIHISDPAKITKFYEEDANPKVIYDNHKISGGDNYVIPIGKTPETKVIATRGQVKLIDPNLAAVNAARHEIKDDVREAVSPPIPMSEETIKAVHKKRKVKGSVCPSKNKRAAKRRQTQKITDIFSD